MDPRAPRRERRKGRGKVQRQNELGHLGSLISRSGGGLRNQAHKYSTKPGVVPLTEDEIDDLVDEWTPEPLVGSPTTNTWALVDIARRKGRGKVQRQNELGHLGSLISRSGYLAGLAHPQLARFPTVRHGSPGDPAYPFHIPA
jgi:hypothetical protein